MRERIDECVQELRRCRSERKGMGKLADRMGAMSMNDDDQFPALETSRRSDKQGLESNVLGISEQGANGEVIACVNREMAVCAKIVTHG
jgi:hypothetical protein